MENSIIKELVTEEEVMSAYPVMNQLRTHLEEQTYLDLVLEAKEKEQYKLCALFHDEEIVAVIGFQPMTTLYYGRFVWVCDLVTAVDKRSKGYGEKLLTYVHEWAKTHRYESVALSSGVQRIDAHRFYEQKMNYDKVSFMFKHTLL
ncbi:GNAT family N-acetyltransferase [Bacillaceae bacterium SAS-127]|nr:GNAT family N-acetyltransferase [Bacillaceae bacterium SAS-127]